MKFKVDVILSKNQSMRGFVLPLVLVLVLVVGFIALAMLDDTAQQERQSGLHVRQAQLFELAEAQLMNIERTLLRQPALLIENNTLQGTCGQAGSAQIQPPSSFQGVAFFPYADDACRDADWVAWLNQQWDAGNVCVTELQPEAVRLAEMPEGWQTCVVIWQARQVGLEWGQLEVHGGGYAPVLPIWRYLILVHINVPEAQGGGRVVLQSLLNAEAVNELGEES